MNDAVIFARLILILILSVLGTRLLWAIVRVCDAVATFFEGPIVLQHNYNLNVNPAEPSESGRTRST